MPTALRQMTHRGAFLPARQRPVNNGGAEVETEVVKICWGAGVYVRRRETFNEIRGDGKVVGRWVVKINGVWVETTLPTRVVR